MKKTKKQAKRHFAALMVLAMTASLLAAPISASAKTTTKKQVQSVTITKPDTKVLVLKKGKTYKLGTSVKVTGKASKKVTYKSSKSKVVSVSKTGKLKALKKGTAKVTVTSTADKKKKATLTVKVGTPITKVAVDKSEITGEAGGSYTLKTTITPKKATYAKVTYKSSDASVAKVSSTGEISFVGEGTAKITVTAADGSGKKAVCTVTVTKKESADSTKPEDTAAGGSTAAGDSASTGNSSGTGDSSNTGNSSGTGDSTNTGGSTADKPEEEDTSKNITQYDGYTLVWNDEFSGDTLNTDDWNIEAHEPGWVNSELQKYVNAEENEETGNITVKDGNLIIKPVKTGEGEDATYTSGRINTQNKHDFTYGRFEVRAKVPEGMGYLPAFWMMPTDENIYGQWPRCGEIDIMEVMGQDTKTAYGTIHYGNPHDQSQGTNVLTSGDYASEYHTYSVDWEPGKITWYIDGVKYHEANDWYSTTVGQGTVSYPAPFDQPFYLILNLAVGGSWVGYPDDTTDFDNQAFVIDYVRAYQKTNGYSEEGVTRPEKEDVVLREPIDDSGNYIYNGSFADSDDLTGKDAEGFTSASNWEFMTALGGEAAAEIADNGKFGENAKAIEIQTAKAGTADYSVQLVQKNIPLDKGNTYTVTFDAYAAEDRTMIVDVSAPDHNYTRYLADTQVALTTEKQTFTYTFNMDSDKDANGRLEFNLGNTSSTATVYISNVSIKKTGTFVIDDSRQPLTDGNYVYNGSFQEGTGRMEYWTVSGSGAENASYSVTSLSDGRRFKISTTNCTAASDVVLQQTGLPLEVNGNYALSFDAELEGDADTSADIKVVVAGIEKTFTITNEKKTYTAQISTGDAVTESDITFDLGINGTVLLDNVRVDEDALIKNGSFNAGLSGYEVYAYTASDVSYVVDSQQEDNAFDITIKDTNTAEWMIQLKQDNVTLEEGQWYTLKFDAKSSVERTIQYAIQRDGSDHKTETGEEDWTPYVQDTAALSSAYTTIEKTFQMTEGTDTEAIFNIAMGTVGARITDQHRICIDNISLVKVDAPEQEEVVDGDNLLKNADFSDVSNAMANWTETIAQDWGPNVQATRSLEKNTDSESGNSIVYGISDLGSDYEGGVPEDWNIQLKQSGISLEEGKTYKASYTITSTAARQIKSGVMSTSYTWYGGIDPVLEANKATQIEFTFTMEATDTAADFYISMGQIWADGTKVDTPPSTITISDIKLVEVSNTETE